MNFYEELERECKNAGISGRIVSIPDELKPTNEDFIELENNISVKTEENRKMLFLSELYAKNSMPCAKVKKITRKI